MAWTGRPARRRLMARWRAASSSCMATSAARPPAVARGGSCTSGLGARSHPGARGRRRTGTGRNDAASAPNARTGTMRCRSKGSDALSVSRLAAWSITRQPGIQGWESGNPWVGWTTRPSAVRCPAPRRSHADASAAPAQQRRWGSAVPPGLDAVAQEGQHVLALLPTSMHDRQYALHEPAPLRAVCPTARLAPQHPLPLGPPPGVVGRLHALDINERPQPPLVGKQFSARPRRLATAARLAAPQHPPESLSHGLDGRLKTWP